MIEERGRRPPFRLVFCQSGARWGCWEFFLKSGRASLAWKVSNNKNFCVEERTYQNLPDSIRAGLVTHFMSQGTTP